MGIISGSVSFRGRFGDHFRVGDHFGGCTDPCFAPQHTYQDLSTRYDWPVKKAIVNLPIRLKGNSPFR